MNRRAALCASLAVDRDVKSEIAGLRRAQLCAIPHGARVRAKGSALQQGEEPINWTADGHALDNYQPGELPANVYRLDVTSGKRDLGKEIDALFKCSGAGQNMELRLAI